MTRKRDTEQNNNKNKNPSQNNFPRCFPPPAEKEKNFNSKCKERKGSSGRTAAPANPHTREMHRASRAWTSTTRGGIASRVLQDRVACSSGAAGSLFFRPSLVSRIPSPSSSCVLSQTGRLRTELRLSALSRRLFASASASYAGTHVPPCPNLGVGFGRGVREVWLTTRAVGWAGMCAQTR
jgi:hypothetical protein